MRSTHCRSCGEAVSALRHLPEVDHPQHDRERRVELVAGDFDERTLDPIGLEQLGVGVLELGQERVLLDDQVVVLDGLADDDRKELGVAGLGEIAEDVSLVDGVDDGADIGVGREEQAGRFGANGHRTLKHFDAAHPRHSLVRQDHVDPRGLFEEFDRLGPVLEGGDLVVHSQQVLHRSQDVGLVVHDTRIGLPVFGWRRRTSLARARLASSLADRPVAAVEAAGGRALRPPPEARCRRALRRYSRDRDGDSTLPRFVVAVRAGRAFVASIPS